MTTLELVSELALSDGVPVVPSTVIAERFGKRHNDVLRAIRNLVNDLPAEFHERNFAQTVVTRPNPSGGAPIESPAYTLTRDAFSLLVMGFTGPEAMRWKLNFITAFNGLERLARESAQREHDERLRLDAAKAAGTAAMDRALSLTPVQYVVAKNIMRYQAMGLERWEIQKILGVSRETIRLTIKKLGLSAPVARQRPLPIAIRNA